MLVLLFEIKNVLFEFCRRVNEAIQFMVACGLDSRTPIMTETEYYVSHECLLLDYEQALTREDSTTGLWCGPMFNTA